MNCTWQVREGDVTQVLQQLAPESVHCVVTSPPFWSLRDYGVPGQLGLEQTPEEYVAKLVGVFAELHRVLRKDGTLWLDMGDTYAAGGRGPQGSKVALFGSRTHMDEARKAQRARGESARRPAPGYKAKDLIGLPWMVAFALRASGWWLRADCIWHKSNPTPEPIRDRPSRSHEYLFLLSKRFRYFYDDVAVMEPVSGTAHSRGAGTGGPKVQAADDPYAKNNSSFSAAVRERVLYRNKRTVWTMPTQPISDEHFAAFPEKLVEPCILAGTSERGVCAECGAPRLRQVDRQRLVDGGPSERKAFRTTSKSAPGSVPGPGHRRVRCERLTTGWAPGCKCSAADAPATVLDPFCGSGTTGIVALKYGRNFIGIELKSEYVAIARRRLARVSPLFAKETA